MSVTAHLTLPRLLAHAGSDTEYRSIEEVEATESRDPIVRSAELAIEHGVLSAEKILDLYESIRIQARAAARRATARPKLTSADEVI